LAATFPTTVASTTNITAGTITTVTNLTNLPSIPSNWLTAAGIAASALNGKGDWNVGKTGYSLTATTGLGNQTANITGNLSGSVGSVTGLTAANLDVAVSTRLATAGYTAPDNAGISSNGSAIAALNDITVADILGATVPDTYTIGQVGYQLGLIAAPVAGSTSLNTRATGFVLTTGSETNSYLDTRVADGTLHTIDDDTNVIDCYYEAEVGQTGIPVAVSILANLQSGNDIVTVYGYNWGTTSWEAVGTLPGTGSSSLSNYSWPLFGAHVGTGANLGKVRVRFAILSGGSSPSLQIDLFYVQYAVVATDSMFEGQAQSGTSASITFPTTANANNGYYIPGVVVLTGGTGAGQASRITAYNGTTKVADVATPWIVTPDATTTFAVKHWANVRVQNMEDDVITAASIASDAGAEIATAVWDKVLS
ncbi:hypothetical protein KC963_01300, partial [Candidatus Saccharibacteria bacterium]|nr:hypothetical protein [Candidatus Saccharibacteria bacterium]